MKGNGMVGRMKGMAVALLALLLLAACSGGDGGAGGGAGGGVDIDDPQPPISETKTFTIAFNANAPDGTLAKGEMAAQTVKEGNVLAILKNAFTIEGYTFRGWAEDASATEATYADGQEIIVSSDTTLYAVWEKEAELPPGAETFTVTFEANAPEGESVSGTMAVQVFAEGQPRALAANAYSIRKGYSFRGWALDKSATVEDYKDGERITVSADTALYAVWDTGLIIEEIEFFGISLGSRVTGVNEYLSDYVIIPVDVGVDEGVFDGCDIVKTIEVRSNEMIADGVFAGCNHLETIVFSPEVNDFSFQSIKNCLNLTEFVVASANETFKASNDGHMLLSKDGSVLYAVVKDLSGSNIIKDVTLDKNTMFVNVERLVLENVCLPINYNFQNCIYLKGIVLKNITVDGSFLYAFRGCTGLQNADLSESGLTEMNQQFFDGCTNLSEVKLPSGVKEINYSAFKDCKSLESLTIPGSLNVIRGSPFDGSAIKTINFEGTAEQWNDIFVANDSDKEFLKSITVKDSSGNIIVQN